MMDILLGFCGGVIALCFLLIYLIESDRIVVLTYKDYRSLVPLTSDWDDPSKGERE